MHNIILPTTKAVKLS